MTQHPASKFRDLRANYFAIAKKHGFEKAFYILEKERDKNITDPKLYVGLLSELIFFKEGYLKMDLTPTLDCGDHCDFTGQYNNYSARFDVTSSLKYKNLEDYSKFQKEGRKYYIALVDHNSKKIDRIIDVNFPFCKQCDGHLINVALIGDIKYTEQGTATQSHQTIQVCSNDFSHNQSIDDYEYFIPSINEEIENLINNDKKFNKKELYDKYGINNALFFGKLIDDKIHACGHEKFINMDDDGEGDFETQLFWMSDMVNTILPEHLGSSIWD